VSGNQVINPGITIRILPNQVRVQQKETRAVSWFGPSFALLGHFNCALHKCKGITRAGDYL